MSASSLKSDLGPEKCHGQHPECIRWTATSQAWWDAQRAWNAETSRRSSDHESRLSSLERKVIFMSGVAAAIGSIVGAVASSFLGG